MGGPRFESGDAGERGQGPLIIFIHAFSYVCVLCEGRCVVVLYMLTFRVVIVDGWYVLSLCVYVVCGRCLFGMDGCAWV